MKKALFAFVLFGTLFALTNKPSVALAHCETYESPCGGNEDRTGTDIRDEHDDGDRHDNDDDDRGDLN